MATATILGETQVHEIMSRVMLEHVPDVVAFRRLSAGALTAMMRHPIFDAISAELKSGASLAPDLVSATLATRKNFERSEWRDDAAAILIERFDDQPIAVIRTGQGQRHYLYDYVEYGPNPSTPANPLRAAVKLTDGMYGRPQWMRDLVADLNSRVPKLDWHELDVAHRPGSTTYRLIIPEPEQTQAKAAQR